MAFYPGQIISVMYSAHVLDSWAFLFSFFLVVSCLGYAFFPVLLNIESSWGLFPDALLSLVFLSDLILSHDFVFHNYISSYDLFAYLLYNQLLIWYYHLDA